eukprot:6200430-Pleurochrysis_carterae.AAC.1
MPCVISWLPTMNDEITQSRFRAQPAVGLMTIAGAVQPPPSRQLLFIMLKRGDETPRTSTARASCDLRRTLRPVARAAMRAAMRAACKLTIGWSRTRGVSSRLKPLIPSRSSLCQRLRTDPLIRSRDRFDRTSCAVRERTSALAFTLVRSLAFTRATRTRARLRAQT